MRRFKDGDIITSAEHNDDVAVVLRHLRDLPGSGEYAVLFASGRITVGTFFDENSLWELFE